MYFCFRESNNSSAPVAVDSFFPGKINSRSNTNVDSESTAVFNTDGGLSEILFSLTLNEALTRNCLNNSELRNLDLVNLQNLQAFHAFKYSQQSPKLLNSFFNSNYTQSASQVRLSVCLVLFRIVIVLAAWQME